MADGAGKDLLYGNLAAGQTGGIIFGGKVAHQRRDPVTGTQKRQRLFQKCRLARTWAGNEADGQHARLAETLAQGTGEYVVLFQDILADFNETRFRSHHLISSATTSSSFPWTISVVGVKHLGQQNH